MSDNFYAGQVDYIPQLNKLWDRATTSVIGTSTSSLSISTGSKTFTTDTYLQFAVGSQITITATADLSKYMSGQVTAYNQETGAITVNITSTVGSGTFTSWSLTLSGAAGAKGDKGDTGDTGATGATGAAGAPNVLSIGTVTDGAIADATITGTSPAQVLNLVLPKGDTGDTGATGAKGLNAKGAWNGATPYVVDDWVTYVGSSYYRKIAGTTGTDPAADTTNWGVLALKGTDGAGAVSSVTASAPLSSTGGGTPNITIQVANTTQGGYLTNTDWNTFNGKAPLVSPSFTTPSLGVASATSINKVFITAPATSATITVADGKTFTSSNTLTFTGTDGSTLNVGAGGTLGTAAYTASTAYAPAAGSASITTVGTVGTGTWNADVVAGQYGGTGVANTGKTITLGGNFTTSGAFTTTFTVTANTSVTFPVSGTLLSTAAAVTVAQGGTGLSTLTSGSVLVGAGTSSPTLVAPSTSGNVLTSNGTTWVSSAPAGGSDLVLITGSTFSGATTVDFTSVFTSTYDGYLIVCRDIMPTTQMELWMQFFTGTSTIINTNYTWSYLAKSYSGNAYSSSTSTSAGTSVRMSNSGSVTTPSDHSISLNIDLGKMTGTRKKNCFWKGVYSASSDVMELGGTGSHSTTSDVTGVRFLINGGTISGSIQIYGYKKAV